MPHPNPLTTPELLTLILHHLPPKDLLLLQRTSHLFRSLTENITSLQQKLGFYPIPRITSTSTNKSTDWPLPLPSPLPTPNPLLTSSFSPFLPVPFNPDIVDLHTQTGRVLRDLPWAQDAHRVAACMRASASWRKLLVVQPPVRRLRVRFCAGVQGEPVVREALVDCVVDGGLRMGLLWDLCQEEVRDVKCIFAVHWAGEYPVWGEGGYEGGVYAESGGIKTGNGTGNHQDAGDSDGERERELTLRFDKWSLCVAGKTGNEHDFYSEGFRERKLGYRLVAEKDAWDFDLL